MDKKKSIAIIMSILILCVYASGCRSIYVGGSGKVGDVTGRGEVDIPIPEKKLTPQSD